MELPGHISELILNKLESSVDYLQFAATCATWNSVSKLAPPSLKHQVPKLLVQNVEGSTCDVYDVVSEKFTGLKQSVSPNTRFCGSSLGWLVFVNDDFTVTLQKSCFRVEDDHDLAPIIILPSILEIDYPDQAAFENSTYECCLADYYILKTVLSADPIQNRKDCVVAVTYGRKGNLAFFRLATDTSWNKIENKEGHYFCDILYHRNRFYSVNSFNGLVGFDVPQGNDPVVITEIVPKSKVDLLRRHNHYLVSSLGGELLLVVKNFSFTIRRDFKFYYRVTRGFEIYKLDTAAGEWMELTSIGKDVSLFLGDNTSLCVLASSSFKCEPNSIYFTQDMDKATKWSFHTVSDFGIYNLSTKIIKVQSGLNSVLIKCRCKQPPIWVVPAPRV